jgi:hypothetical protein
MILEFILAILIAGLCLCAGFVWHKLGFSITLAPGREWIKDPDRWFGVMYFIASKRVEVFDDKMEKTRVIEETITVEVEG